MNLEIAYDFLLWCLIINVGIFSVSILLIPLFDKFAYSVHSKVFKITPEQFHGAIYSAMAYYKITIIFFNFVPLIAILILK
jgi:hypothetical protein